MKGHIGLDVWTEPTNFIEEFKCPDNVVDDLLHYFNRREDCQAPGTFGDGEMSKNPQVAMDVRKIDKERKDSQDLTFFLQGSSENQDYLNHLNESVEIYARKYETLLHMMGIGLAEQVNIQHYPISGGYKEMHCERLGYFNQSIKRVLVFMTYLNDVPDGGTTFKYYNHTEKAKKGKTIIWPSDWTHTHCGEISHTSEKFIITGWISHLWDIP